MTNRIEEAGELIASARRDRRRIRLPQPLKPASAAEAYAIQDSIGRRIFAGGNAVPGWKVGAPDALTEPNAAPVFEVIASPARIAPARLGMTAVEAEIAFVFGAALPPRAAPYTDTEALAAVRELRVAIEVCDSRLDDWQAADDLSKLADHQLNFALVLGDASPRVHEVDFARLAVCTRVDGTVVKEGVGCHAVGNPLTLIPWLANHARSRGGIAAGSAATTGAWLGLHPVAAGARVSVEFAGLGAAEVWFEPE